MSDLGVITTWDHHCPPKSRIRRACLSGGGKQKQPRKVRRRRRAASGSSIAGANWPNLGSHPAAGSQSLIKRGVYKYFPISSTALLIFTPAI